MRKLYSRAVRLTVLWVMLLGTMAVVASRSAVVLASSGPSPLIVCSGFCVTDTDCTNVGCYCASGGTCRPLR
jgi:hypothetical protein